MAIPKKTLMLVSEPDAKLYSCMGYSSEEIGKNGKIYLEKSKELVNNLGLDGNVKELLVIYPNQFLSIIMKDKEGKEYYPKSDMRISPYSLDSNVIEKEEIYLRKECEKEKLLENIDSYIKRNMDHKVLAIVHPALVDFISLILKDRYDIKLAIEYKT